MHLPQMSAHRKRLLIVGVALLAALFAPGIAAAHAIHLDYQFPFPLWVFLLGGSLAVLLSAPAAALAVRSSTKDWASQNLGLLMRLHLGRIGIVLGSLLLLDGLAGGFFGSSEWQESPLPVLIWVNFWCGLGIVSALFGNLWDFASPLSAAGRALERALARRNVQVRQYPNGLGVWPSVVLLLAWSWAELIWTSAIKPGYLVWIVISYCVLQLAGMAVFGTEVWLARAELFTVVARTFARFAPFEIYVTEPAGPCRAERCEHDSVERIGCPSCWLDAAKQSRGLRLRAYGAGIRREPTIGAGGSAFVVALLATVVYDGFRSTTQYASFQDALNWGAGSINSIGTVMLILVVGAFTLAYIAVCALASRSEEGGLRGVISTYTPTLIPIAAVYFVAHYFLYFLLLAQTSGKVLADPFNIGWANDYNDWFTLSGAVVWNIELAIIVIGHVIAVLEAHRIALGRHRHPRRALIAQAPLVLLMVGYTFAGLWVLGSAVSSSG
jgi:hypothetical protein